MNLTTRISNVEFNHSNEILSIYSSSKHDQFRLFHINSRTMFQNFPTSNTPLHYVTSTQFSSNSGYLAIGNDRGRVLLYRLNHFNQA